MPANTCRWILVGSALLLGSLVLSGLYVLGRFEDFLWRPRVQCRSVSYFSTNCGTLTLFLLHREWMWRHLPAGDLFLPKLFCVLIFAAAVFTVAAAFAGCVAWGFGAWRRRKRRRHERERETPICYTQRHPMLLQP